MFAHGAETATVARPTSFRRRAISRRATDRRGKASARYLWGGCWDEWARLKVCDTALGMDNEVGGAWRRRLAR